MHRALYRTYRPAVFDDVVGQDHITSVLRYEVKQGKTSHAYLFCGSRGTGKTSCAKILSKAVNCLSPVNGNPCLLCENCRAIDEGRTTDVLEMDAASNTGVDYIRDIKDAVMYAPSMLKNRVYIIDEVHMLSDGAFNALLKTLEEPPENVVFILATTEMQKIPSTILSRCQRFEFRRIAAGVIAKRLHYIADKEGVRLDDEAAFLIARSAQGGMRDAISLLELCSAGRETVTFEDVEKISGGMGRKIVEKTVAAIADKDPLSLFDIISSLFASSGDPAVFWQDLIAYYRDMIVYQTAKNMGREELRKEILDLTEGEFERLKELSSRFRYETLIWHSGVLDAAFASTSGKNGVSARVSTEMTLVRLTMDRASSSAEALLSRISALEEKTAELSLALAQGAVPVSSQSRFSENSGPKNADFPENSLESVKPQAAEKIADGLSLDGVTDRKAKQRSADLKSSSEEKAPAGNRDGQPKPFPEFVEILHDFIQKEPNFSNCFTGSAEMIGDHTLRVYVKDTMSLKLVNGFSADVELSKIVSQSLGRPCGVEFASVPESDAPKDPDQLGFADLFGDA